MTIVGTELIQFGRDPREIAREIGATGVQAHDEVQGVELARLIGKIGYGLYVAQHGIPPRNEVPVLPAILGDVDDIGAWVGSGEFTLDVEAQRPTHALGVARREENGAVHGAARVKLFATSGATGYEVVIQAPDWRDYVDAA